MSSTAQAQIAALEESILRRVELRSQAVFYLLVEKNRDTVGLLSEMPDDKRTKFILKRVMPSYEEAKWFLGFCETQIMIGKEAMNEAVEKGEMPRAKDYASDLVEWGESLVYWELLFDAAKDFLDAAWRLGISVPIADIDQDDEGMKKRPKLYSLFDSGAEKLQKKARAAADSMDEETGAGYHRRGERRRGMDDILRRKRQIHTGKSDEKEDKK